MLIQLEEGLGPRDVVRPARGHILGRSIDVIREAYRWDGPLTVVSGVGGREGMGLWGEA